MLETMAEKTPDQAALDSAADFEKMSVEDLADWLKDKGIPDEFCSAFKGELNFIGIRHF